MKNLVTIGIILLCAYTSIAQNKENTWLFKDSQNDLTFNFEEEVFKIDTLVTIEGHIYVAPAAASVPLVVNKKLIHLPT